MRTTEGKGRIPPNPVRVPLETKDLSFALAVARRRVEYRGYARRSDQWGRGLNGDPVLTVFHGLLGEIAFAKWLSSNTGIVVSVDDTNLPFGDGGKDFDVAGRIVQVKTAATDYRELFIKTSQFASPSDNDDWRVCVRAHWQPARFRRTAHGLFGSYERRERVVDLCGFTYRDEFHRHSVIEPARKGTHFNYVLNPEWFHPMQDLADLINATTTWREVTNAKVG